MDIVSLRRRIERIVHIHSSSFIPEIVNSGFLCVRCGWCCRKNFDIKITNNISRPSNAISIFPGDIKRIIKNTGHRWNEVAEPDIYSCFSEGDDVSVIGWILKRNDDDNCVFYKNGECTIYSCRPMICRCYPFFIKEENVEIMHCNGLGKMMGKMTATEQAKEIGIALKRYELMKLQNYIKIIEQIGDKLNMASIKSLTASYSGEVIVFDGEKISRGDKG